MDNVKGDSVYSLPGHYAVRNRRVRAAFDILEREFEAEVPDVIRKAIETRETDRDAVAHILDEFSERCINKVVGTIRDLLKGLD